MLYIYRGFPLRKVPAYMIAQVLGAFIAAMIAFGLYKSDIIAYGGSDLANSGTLSAFITYPRYEYVGKAQAFFNEFTGTAVLTIAVLALVRLKENVIRDMWLTRSREMIRMLHLGLV